jgi:ParB family chromosome partitioning protein
MSRRARAESTAALESATTTEETPAPAATVTAAAPAFAELNPGIVIPSPLNPRRAMDKEGLEELAASIVANGVLQPILVRPAANIADYVRVPGEDHWYEVICGARRLAAVTLALQDGRLPQDFRIPARIRECTDAELVLLAATENLARADMHPLDEAEVFAAMRPHVKPADGQTTEAAIGRALGVSERTVFRRLSLLRCAPEVREALREKTITLGQAQALQRR